ncbi:mitochondrial ubiquitin ligase activator of NFKB 1 [Protopterus annectens]|uniref:mitochondrial ubiquitin ligase activator of NFKB 1 n=1 Tax=Protopterus annectens TaxID=7888 RepID=UPI001CFBA78E|nr:mitochondrial ubiquitin ligase activator of NFKB 1 [Protopterus annectens]
MEGNGRPSVGQVILLAASSTVTAVLYMIYKRKSALVSGLKDAKKISIDADLKKVLMETPGKCVPYAVIEGVVKSVKETLNSQFVDNCKGVIQRLTLQEHKMVWNRTTHLWSDHEKIIHQRTNTVPFDLVSDNVDVCVRVVKPLDATELDLETVYEKYHPAVQSLANVLSHYISGEQPKGIKETEEMLKVGAAVTGVGELVLDNNIIKLQPPKQGMAYYLSKLDFESLIQKQDSTVKRWKVLTIVFSAITFVTIFFILRRQYRFFKEKQMLKRMQDEIRERNAHLFQGADGHERDAALNICGICLTNSRSCVFLECGHVCSCDDCYNALPLPKKCPICRMYISRVVPLYNS